MTVAKVRLAMTAMGKPKTKVADLCRELGVTRQTLYRHVSPAGNLREDGRKLLKTKRRIYFWLNLSGWNNRSALLCLLNEIDH